MRIRTINKAIEEIKKEDAGTALSSSRIRKWIADGTIKTVKSGSRNLVDVDEIIEHISRG